MSRFLREREISITLVRSHIMNFLIRLGRRVVVKIVEVIKKYRPQHHLVDSCSFFPRPPNGAMLNL